MRFMTIIHYIKTFRNCPGLLARMYVACLPHREHRGIKGGECVGATLVRKMPPPSPLCLRWGKPRGSTYTWVVTTFLYSTGLLATLALWMFCVTESIAQEADSRIKTFIYDETQVFKVTTHFGYQSNIEFDQGEEIETISIGDSASWQIVPARKFLFIRPMHDKAHTNMTVVTNRRTYQFDLRSTPITSTKQKNLIYVMRFHYPENDIARSGGSVQQAAQPVAAQSGGAAGGGGYNYSYTLSGDQSIAPLKVFDDGRRTYMQFPPGVAPTVLRMMGGQETAVATSQSGGYTVVDIVQPNLTVQANGKMVKIFNEAMLGGGQR